jgi:pimeloyl-ACP methyl ester carboxylesterase
MRRVLASTLAAALVLVALHPARAARADERVDITATDGVQLIGHLAGSEGPGIVFGHMYPADQRSWTAFAQEMAQAGFRTLTFDFRGYGESGGGKDIAAIDRDMEGAYRYVIGRKIRPVYLVGASMGGTAALIVAARVPVAGVATLSAPLAFRGLDATPVLSKLAMPKLFIASADDLPAAEAVKELAINSADPKLLKIVPGTAHGTELLTTAQAGTVKEALHAFFLPHPVEP